MDGSFERPSAKYAKPARQSATAVPNTISAPKAEQFRRRQSATILFVILLFTLVGIGGSLLWNHITNSRSPIPDKVLRSASFPLYYPKPMPDGFRIDPYSFESSSGFVAYKLVNTSQNISITVSLQPKPTKFDTSNFNDPTSQTQPISLPVGTAYIVATGGQTRYVVLTQKALVFLTPNGNADDTTIKPILFSLTVAR